MTHTRIRAAARRFSLGLPALLAALGLLTSAKTARAAGEAVDVTLVDARALAAPLDSVRAAAPPPADASALRGRVPAQDGGDLVLPSLAGPALRSAIGGFSAVQARALRAGAASLASRTAQPARSMGVPGLPAGLSKAARQWLTQYYLPLPALNSAYGVYSSAAEQAEADSIFAQVNQIRAKKGAGQLRRDAHLDAVAQAHALHMARAGFFEHASPFGMEVFERIDAAGGPKWRAAGENIAAGQRDAREVHDTWMRSKGHRHNILGEQYESVGIGAAYLPGTEYGWYWVQVFATLDGHDSAGGWIEPAGALSSAPVMREIARSTAPPEPRYSVQPQQRYPAERASADDRDNAPCLTGG